MVSAVLVVAGRYPAAILFGVLSVIGLVLAARTTRSMDTVDASSRLLGLGLLLASLAGSAASGGLLSPLVISAGLAAALSASYGRAQGAAWALIVPVVLVGGHFVGGYGEALASHLEWGLTVATLALVSGGSAELILAEVAASHEHLDSDSEVSSSEDVLLSNELSLKALAALRRLLDQSPVGIFVLDQNGGFTPQGGMYAQPRADSPLSDSSEILGWVARTNRSEDLRLTREALLSWSEGVPPIEVINGLPSCLPHPSGVQLGMAYAPVLSRDNESLDRIICSAQPLPSRAVTPPGAILIRDVLEVCARKFDCELGMRVNPEEGNISVPAQVAAQLATALDALIDNARLAIESAEVRAARVKPSQGQVELRARQRGRALVLSVADDGGGIDWEGVARSAASAGWPCGSRSELEAALVKSGLSTLGHAGEGLGRARSAMEALGGQLVLATTVEGEGTLFELILPNEAQTRTLSGTSSQKHHPRTIGGSR